MSGNLRANFVLSNFQFIQSSEDGGLNSFRLQVATDAPMVQVDWGATGIDGSQPRVVSYPNPGPNPTLGELLFGQLLPRGGQERSYPDGSYRILVEARSGNDVLASEVLRAFLDTANTEDAEKRGSGKDDMISLGSGNDLAFGSNGDDAVLGGFGDDTLYGGNGADSISGGAGNDRIFGNTGADFLYGDGGDDTIFGGAGRDYLIGGDGNDILRGGEQDDQLYGGKGSDRLYGDAGDDFLSGDEGNDVLFGGSGSDFFWSGVGADRLVSETDGEQDIFLYFAANEGGDTVIGFEPGIDKVQFAFLNRAQMTSERFVSSSAQMTDTGPWVIYGSRGRLSLDLNGTAAGESYEIARFQGAPALTYGDLLFGTGP
jgi:Ca2+-binding RTX toxin-like protein